MFTCFLFLSMQCVIHIEAEITITSIGRIIIDLISTLEDIVSHTSTAWKRNQIHINFEGLNDLEHFKTFPSE